MEQENNTSTIVVSVMLVLGVLWSVFGSESSPSSSYSGDYDYDYSEEQTIDRYDAKSDYWDDIAEYLDGTYTIEACSDSSGNCYEVDAEINSGDISMIYFSNGGYLDIYGGDVDSDGDASGDSDDDYWTFTVDDDDLDEAIDDWAYSNDYTLE